MFSRGESMLFDNLLSNLKLNQNRIIAILISAIYRNTLRIDLNNFQSKRIRKATKMHLEKRPENINIIRVKKFDGILP